MNRRPHLLLATSATLALACSPAARRTTLLLPRRRQAPPRRRATRRAHRRTGPAQGRATARRRPPRLPLAAGQAAAARCSNRVRRRRLRRLRTDRRRGARAPAADQDDAAQTYAEALTTDEAVAAYVGDGTTAQYAGATGKLLAVTDAADLPTDSIGGRDLTAELLALQTDEGRFHRPRGPTTTRTRSRSRGPSPPSPPRTRCNPAGCRLPRRAALRGCWLPPGAAVQLGPGRLRLGRGLDILRRLGARRAGDRRRPPRHHAGSRVARLGRRCRRRRPSWCLGRQPTAERQQHRGGGLYPRGRRRRASQGIAWLMAQQCDRR